jgi:drug/metabolite transporter (DMT)-like permease
MLAVLGAIWGAAFMLIEIGLRDFQPATLVLLRLGSAALTLGLFIVVRRRVHETVARLRPHAARVALAAFVIIAVPFVLIAWGQQYVTSSLAAILNASAPLFTVLLAAAAVHSERVRGRRLAGFLVGFGGVVLAVGGDPTGGAKAVTGALAVVAAGVCYAAGALYVARRLGELTPLEVSLGMLVFATLFTLPLGLADLPQELGWKPLAAVLCLGVIATAVAFQLYFALIAGAGASRAILVTYLVPALAVVYGVVLLDEELTSLALGGLILVLLGVTLGTARARVASEA